MFLLHNIFKKERAKERKREKEREREGERKRERERKREGERSTVPTMYQDEYEPELFG